MEPPLGAASDLPLGYVEHAPAPDLAGRVVCFWTRVTSRGRAEAAGHRVLPDGCVDFIVTFGGAPGAREISEAIAVGAMTRALVVPAGGPGLWIGVRFRPGYAFAAFGIPGTDATDITIPLGVVEREARALEDRLSAIPSDRDKLSAFIAYVRLRLAGAPDIPASVRAAVGRIERTAGNLRVADLAAETGVSRQQLARQFAIHVGVSPKTLARVMRARAVLARADAARAAYPRVLNWSAIAQDLGYYDQPHLIDDVKEITGMTPGEWVGGT